MEWHSMMQPVGQESRLLAVAIRDPTSENVHWYLSKTETCLYRKITLVPRI
jgi:hypothetical protein